MAVDSAPPNAIAASRVPVPVSSTVLFRAFCRGLLATEQATRARALHRAQPLFLFFDESGSLEWKSTDSPLYHFGVVSTWDPASLEATLAPIRYDVFGRQFACRLHATEDRQAVRDRVFGALRRAGGFEFDAVTVDKAQVPVGLREPHEFYPHFATMLLQHVFDRYATHTGRIVLVTDRLPVKRQCNAVEKAFKRFLAQRAAGRPYHLLHSPSESFGGLQVADYCTWAVHKLRLHGDERPYAQIAPFVRRAVQVRDDGHLVLPTPPLHWRLPALTAQRRAA